MRGIPVRVAHVVLHVSDQDVAPVGDIQGTVAPDLDVGRTEVGVRGDEDRLDLFCGDVGPVEADLVLQDALEPDRVADQEVAVGVLGKVRTGEETCGGHRADALREPLLVSSALADIDVAAGASGSVVGELKTPAVKGVAVRVGSDREVKLDLERPRVEAVDTRLARPVGAGGGFHVGDVEDASRPVQPAVGADNQGVGRVVGVGTGDALEHADLHVGLVVAVGVFEEPDLRRSGHQHATAPELETGHAVELVGKNHAAVSHAVAVIIGQAENPVGARLGGVPVGVGRPDRGEQAAVGVDGHLYRVDQLGELLLGGEQVDLHSLGHPHSLDCLAATEVGMSTAGQ